MLVNSNGGDTVNVRVPLGLLRTGIKLSTMVPAAAGDNPWRRRGQDWRP